jgi:hypothetical protein
MRSILPSDEQIVPAAKQLRVALRQRTLKSAKIVLGNWCAIDCTLRDVSETGAKIRVSDVTSIPAEFRLFTATDNMIRDVKVAWKRQGEVGVIFMSPAAPYAMRKI